LWKNNVSLEYSPKMSPNGCTMSGPRTFGHAGRIPKESRFGLDILQRQNPSVSRSIPVKHHSQDQSLCYIDVVRQHQTLLTMPWPLSSSHQPKLGSFRPSIPNGHLPSSSLRTSTASLSKRSKPSRPSSPQIK
jgi:hypothetical protein